MSRSFSRVTAMLAALAFAATASVTNAQTINLPDKESPTSPFGKGKTATYGQTFTATAGFNYLQSFSFWLSNDVAGLGLANPASLRFRAYVMKWDAVSGHAIGPVLYSSSIQSGPSALSQRYDFASANTLLGGSGQYVAFLSASGLFGSIGVAEATAGMETTFNGSYAGGQFVFSDNGDNLGLLSTNAWDLAGGFPEYQSHFFAQFSSAAVSVVPEPSTFILLVTGVAMLLVVSARKKRA